MDAIHTFAREGELDNFLKCIESGVSVHLQGLFLFSCFSSFKEKTRLAYMGLKDFA